MTHSLSCTALWFTAPGSSDILVFLPKCRHSPLGLHASLIMTQCMSFTSETGKLKKQQLTLTCLCPGPDYYNASSCLQQDPLSTRQMMTNMVKHQAVASRIKSNPCSEGCWTEPGPNSGPARTQGRHWSKSSSYTLWWEHNCTQLQVIQEATSFILKVSDVNGDFGLRFQSKITYRDLIFRMFWKSGPFKGSGLHPRNGASKMKSH